MAGAPDPETDPDVTDVSGDTGGGTRGWVPDERVLELERTGRVEGFVPRVDYAALGVRTVLVFLRVGSDVDLAALVADHDGPITDAHETTGPWDALLVTRFTSTDRLTAFLGLLATDDRVEAIETNVVARTVLEDDAPPLE